MPIVLQIIPFEGQGNGPPVSAKPGRVGIQTAISLCRYFCSEMSHTLGFGSLNADWTCRKQHHVLPYDDIVLTLLYGWNVAANSFN